METEVDLHIGNELNSDALEACQTKAFREISGGRATPGACLVRFDLSDTRFIQIESLLFLLCVVSSLKRQGVRLRLVLPEKDGRWNYSKGHESEGVTKVRDFLKRWKFGDALYEAVGDLAEVLPPHQETYFDDALSFYKERIGQDETGDDVAYLSSLLLEITHMTRGDTGNRRVSTDRIAGFLNRLSVQRRFQEAVARAVGRRDDNYFAKEFARTLLWESLINTEEHPNATMSMITVARNKKSKELVIAVADNGDPIPRTMLEAFAGREGMQEEVQAVSVSTRDQEIAGKAHGDEGVTAALDDYRRSVAATIHATRWGTTSKPGQPPRLFDTDAEGRDLDPEDANRFLRGMGLYYVKERTLEFRGSLTIRSQCSQVHFTNASGTEEVTSRLLSPWPGNLLRIGLPMVE